jgi:hypothetical protein
VSEHQLKAQARVRSPFEARPVLDEAARRIGGLLGVELAVALTPDGLFFINQLGEIVKDGQIHIIACNEEDIASGEFMPRFLARLFWAALSEMFTQHAIRKAAGGVQ